MAVNRRKLEAEAREWAERAVLLCIEALDLQFNPRVYPAIRKRRASLRDQARRRALGEIESMIHCRPKED